MECNSLLIQRSILYSHLLALLLLFDRAEFLREFGITCFRVHQSLYRYKLLNHQMNFFGSKLLLIQDLQARPLSFSLLRFEPNKTMCLVTHL